MANTVSVAVKNLAGEKVGTVSLSKEVFAIEGEHPQAIADAVNVYLANRRQATAKTKTRHEVSGGGKKPWRQKGTGRARAGSSRSPIWVGGGTVFGPDGRQNYKLSQNKKAHNLALRCVWSDKVKSQGLVVVDSLKLEKISTKEFVSTLNNLKLDGKVLLVGDTDDNNLIYSARNVERVSIRDSKNVSVYDLLNHNVVLISKADIKQVEEDLK